MSGPAGVDLDNPQERSDMPRRQTYGFDKRRKEQDRKAKKDAKLLEKQRRRDQPADGTPPQSDSADGITPSHLPPDPT